MQLKKDFKFKLINNFLSEQEIDTLKKYCIIKHRNNLSAFDLVQDVNGDTGVWNDSLMCVLMEQKLPLLEKETNLKLFPTYSFWRMYTYGAELKKHTDRESCEVSVTVMIGSDGTSWPIYADGFPFDLKPGQALVYLGRDVAHWREQFKGNWRAKTFFHYVDKEGPYKDFKFDKRQYLGEKVE